MFNRKMLSLSVFAVTLLSSIGARAEGKADPIAVANTEACVAGKDVASLVALDCINAALAEYFNSPRVGNKANNTATIDAVGTTVVRAYAPNAKIKSQTKGDFTEYVSAAPVRRSNLTGHVFIAWPMNVPQVGPNLAFFICDAQHDEPVVYTSFTCQNAFGGIPVSAGGHNAAAIAGFTSSGQSAITMRATGLHPQPAVATKSTDTGNFTVDARF